MEEKKMTINVELTGINEAIEQAQKLVKELEKAKSLADDLAVMNKLRDIQKVSMKLNIFDEIMKNL